MKGIESLIHSLGELGYRASVKMAQICQQQVICLGYVLKKRQRWLTEDRKEIVLKIPDPKKAEQVREFLGTPEFCHLWIPGFAEIAKPLYETTKGS